MTELSRGGGEAPSLFDFPIARRTDQFDRFASAEARLLEAIAELEDWTGIWPDTPIVLNTAHPLARCPVHDLPMEYQP